VAPAAWEAEIGGSWFEGSQAKVSMTLSQKQPGLVVHAGDSSYLGGRVGGLRSKADSGQKQDPMKNRRAVAQVVEHLPSKFEFNPRYHVEKK
jgi:phosphodiesterase/alkaline phosphatase D-like protein